MKKPNKVPIGLNHQPIVGVDDYSAFDGLYKNNTDARALSVGLAQWSHVDKDGTKEISAKVFRYPNERWSPQSEELPLHRCFDICMLIIQAVQRSTKGRFFEVAKNSLKPYVVNDKELESIRCFYEKYKDDYLLEKMKNLKDLLDRFLSQEKKIIKL